MSIVFAMLAVLAIVYLVPLVVYGAASTLAGLELPAESSPQRFLVGILATKLGTAIGFVLLFQLTGSAWVGRWAVYGLIWFGVFAASEVGDAISGRSSWTEAGLGILSEAVYAPASAYVTHLILGAA